MAQCSDWQVDLLAYVATGIGPQISIKDLRVSKRGDLILGLQDWLAPKAVATFHMYG